MVCSSAPALLLIVLIFSFANVQLVRAATITPVDPTGRAGEAPPLQKEIQPELPRPGTLLPPPPLAPKFEPIPGLRVFVREIRVTGSTVFTAEELAKVTAPYLNRELTSEDLEALRVALTLLYVNNGYVNSGAILPDQTVTDGVVTFQIVEGGLTGVEVDGNRWFRSNYFQKRFNLDAGPPLNINALQRRLQLLLEDQRIQRLNAELKPGLRRGEGILDVRVEERTPYKLSVVYNNYQSPSVGEDRGIVILEHQNLTGNGDVATAQYGRSRGLDPLLDFKYSFPFTAYDTTASLQYRRNTFAVVEEPFEDLDIDSKSHIYTIAFRQPVYRTLNSEVALEFTGERLSHETLLLGERFSLGAWGTKRPVNRHCAAIRARIRPSHPKSSDRSTLAIFFWGRCAGRDDQQSGFAGWEIFCVVRTISVGPPSRYPEQLFDLSDRCPALR